MSWQEELRENIRSIDSLRRYYASLNVGKQDATEIEEAIEERGVNIPRRYLEDLIDSIRDKTQLEQVKNMVLPRLNLNSYLDSTPTLIDNDRLDNNPVKGLTQMYPDRVLISPNYACMNHCLWCFRDKENKSLSQGELRQIFDYISNHPQIKDVILTGGEPLLTSDAILEEIFI